MKKYLFFFIVIVSSNLFSQNYTPMLELGKGWNMHHYDGVIPDENYDYLISLDYTTEINGIEYFHASNGDFFREDINAKKVYQLIDGVDTLILNFDLNVGDDLVSPLIFIDEGFSKEITTIGTDNFYIVVDTNYYETECGEKIIEGVGVSYSGLFGLSTHCSTLDYSVGDYLIGMVQTLGAKDYFSQNNINLFYNNTQKTLQLNNSTEVLNIKIYSILGKELINTNIDTFIEVSELKKGLYLYSLSINNSSTTGKILIY